MDADTASFRHPNGIDKIRMHTSNGDLANVACMPDDDPSLPQNGKPDRPFPYGVSRFLITGLTAGETVTVSIEFPEAVPTTSQYYKVDSSGQWNEVVFGSNDGDDGITLTLTDGDPLTDADGIENGSIDDPGGLTSGSSAATTTSGGGGGGCFISSLVE